MGRWDRPPRGEDEGNLVRLYPGYHSASSHRLGRLMDTLRGTGGEAPVRRHEMLTGLIPWFGSTRREENHARWEDRDPMGAIRAKALAALEIERRAGGGYKSQVRHQRNNRREY